MNFRDLAPTILEAAATPIPESMSGASLLPNAYICNYGNVPGRTTKESVQKGARKHSLEDLPVNQLIASYPDHPSVQIYRQLLTIARPAEELYDLQSDPWQLKNLIDDSEMADIANNLQARMDLYQRSTHDPRVTGRLGIFERTRGHVQDRKRNNYRD